MLLVNVRFVVIMLMLVSHSQFLFSSPPRLVCIWILSIMDVLVEEY